MSYLVLARKWRPKTFDEVVGQSTVTRTLRNALTSGRIGHAFLLSGARGVGKTTTARILAKAINCSATEQPNPDPCGECPSCLEVASGSSLDVQEIDGATHNGVEQVRELRESARYNPARDRFKIWIIDEVHMLSSGAFNALLKTLEEPPPRVKFIFATTEYHKIPDTILSRCQQYDFRMIPTRELVDHLRHVANGEKVSVSDEALGRLARAAEGSVRDALSLFDQVLSFGGDTVQDEDLGALLGLVDRELLHAAARAIAESDSLAVLELVERLAGYGADYRNYARELLLYFREIMLVKLAADSSPLLSQVLPDERARLSPLAEVFSEEDLLRAFDVLTRAESELRNSLDPRVSLELALLTLVQLRRLVPFAQLVSRVERLTAGQPALPSSPRRVPAIPASTPTSKPAPGQQAPLPPAGSPEPPPSALRSEPPPEPKPASRSASVSPSGSSPRPEGPIAAAGAAAELLRGILEQIKGRPTLAQPLRGATPRLEGGTLILSVAPDFMVLAEAHADEYREIAATLVGRPQAVRFVSGAAMTSPREADEAPVPPSSEPAATGELEQEALRQPAVQEVLDLFGGKVLGVRRSEPESPG
jgi:DNA polymerase-3 subunit gamma/tau